MTMPKRLLPLALLALLPASAALAQDAPEPTPAAEAKPAQAEPAKKPDAFQYFFGKQREQMRKAPAAKAPAAKAPEAKTPEAAPVQPAPPVTATPAPAAASEVRPEPPAVAQPQ